MQLLKRIGYYLIGLSLGAIAVSFFWKQKGAEFDYLPNARTLKNIRVKPRLFSDEAKNAMKTLAIDSTMIATILKTGEVDFSKSKPRKKPCREYWIDAENMQKEFSVIVKNCDSLVTIEKVFIEK